MGDFSKGYIFINWGVIVYPFQKNSLRYDSFIGCLLLGLSSFLSRI